MFILLPSRTWGWGTQIRGLDGSRARLCLQWLQVFQNSSPTYSSGQYWYMFCTVASYVMKRKPRLHDGIVTIDLGKNRLVEIPRSGSEAPDDGFARIQLVTKRPKCNHHQQKECNVHLHVKCACAFGTRDLWLHQNGFVLAIHGIVASQKCRSCQYVVKKGRKELL